MSAKPSDKAAHKSMSTRQWVDLLLLYLTFPLILFVCSLDLQWWQAWVYSAEVFAFGVGGHMLTEQRNPGLIAERQNIDSIKKANPWDKVLAPLMAISIGFPMIIVAGLDHRYQWSSEFPLWLNWLGFMLVALGYGIATWALVENRFFISVVRIQTERGHVVCDTGPYRFIRHPGYAGSVLALFGIVLALDSLWTLLPTAFATVITLIRTQLEDTALHKELPGYSEYARRVKYRLFPGVF
ncbi:isoprenylcysteine carboxylmethyltransferase family protein [Pseudoalteromonas sp. BDTF-M6]|uniref:methyltransferase family protein n=1 Tax=Pseudoalteromonas sp. BDTF-M6 TaxID=2796132 RepID=UPI001BAFFA9B|nr:isoprenylcysteine carboxylmethyltransferase family protein [Pseudoalteromonas sp. BDTF-M6]MBS3797591.1 isoprenylcysteine carboxylmethyltransferase family protein [Pseudoalteromonas sp. BDTF-M6]